MKITFIYINDYLEDYYENYDMAIVSRYLNSNGIETHIDRFKYSCSVDEIFQFCNKDSDFYGFYLYDCTVDHIFDLSKKLKNYNSKVTIFLFGPIASLAAEKILQDTPYVDGIILGDAEKVILDIVRKKQSNSPLDVNKNWYGHSTNRFDKEYAITGICELPFPQHDKRFIQLITSKGCYGKCSFCIHSNYYYKEKGMDWIGLDAEEIFNQIKKLYERYKVYYISFYDKCFSDPPGEEGKKRLSKLFELIVDFNRPIAFSCFCRADSFDETDHTLLSQMRKAGFAQVNVGIESAWEKDLILFNKGTTLNDNKNIMKLFRHHDIEVITDFIMLHPLSTVDSIKSNIDFLQEHGIYRLDIFFSRLRIFYGSPIHKYFKNCGYITDSFSYKDTFRYTYIDRKIEEGVSFFECLLQGNSNLLYEQKNS